MARHAAARLDAAADQAAAALHPVRLRLLESLAEPDSAAGLARRLALPRQRINYHLREMEKAGLVEMVEERKKGNCTERIVKATARSYLATAEALGTLAADPERFPDRFSASYLVALSARAIRDLAVLQRRADRARQRLATFSLQTEVRFARAADRQAFTEELANAVAHLAAKYHNEQAAAGRLFRFFLGAYPAITRPEEDAPPSRPGEEPS